MRTHASMASTDKNFDHSAAKFIWNFVPVVLQKYARPRDFPVSPRFLAGDKNFRQLAKLAGAL